jgi:hypothetical protein
MQRTRSFHHRARSVAVALVLQACSGAVWAYGGSYDPATGVLTGEFVTLGGALFEGMQVTVSGIVSGPTDAGPHGWEYSYNTASNQLTVPTVLVGSTRYNNVVATVGSLVSPGQVSGADSYDGARLAIPYVQVGAAGTVYANVVVAIDRVVRVDGGMPKSARDIYDAGTAQLSIGTVQVGSKIYTNVVVTVATIVSVGGANPPPTLGPSTLHLTCRYNSCLAGFLQLVNTGTSPLNISSIAIDDSNFAQTNDCPAALGAGQSCAIVVSRSLGGFHQGTLTVTDDGAGSPRTVTLIGQ